MKSKLPWSWILTKRLLNMNSPLFEEGNIVCFLATKQFTVADELDELLDSQADFSCGIGTCDKTFSSLTEYESHYNSVHKNVCSICRRFYPTNHLLDIHLLEWHDSMFELMALKQPMFQCLIPTCSVKLTNRKQRKDHMIKVHKYPSNFRFDREKKSTSNNKKYSKTDSDSCKTTESMETNSVERTEKSGNTPKFQYSYRVPQNFSFGQGVSRGFQRKRGHGRGGKTRHWHNQSEGRDLQIDIENVNMNELAEALDTP